MLVVKNASFGYTDEMTVKEMSFSVEKGEFFGILGPNASGKTTLIKLISGLLPLQKGTIEIDGRAIESYKQKELAKQVAVLPQISTQVFPYTVKEMVSLGRYAHHTGFFQTWSEEDEEIVQRVMEQTNIKKFEDTVVTEHSGGEQQRIYLAQALVQNPKILLLDEPTNHLDLAYQKELLDQLRKRAKQDGLTVVAILHDLNLASLYCDRLLLMDNGRARAIENPETVLSEELVQSVYRTEVVKQPHSKIAKPQLHLMPGKQGDANGSRVKIDASSLTIHKDKLVIQSKIPIKTISSGVVGAGTGWYKNFINRHVAKTYDFVHYQEEMQAYLKKEGFEPNQTVGMMTAVEMEDHSAGFYEGDDFSLFVVVTAGVGSAVDATKSSATSSPTPAGTINTWIFVNGQLTEEAFIQSIITATEAKAQVLREFDIHDKETGTQATGTATDSILVAATQQGKKLEFAGTKTELGSLIGRAIYQEMKQAISNDINKKREKGFKR